MSPIQIQNPRAWGRLVDAFTIRGRHKLLLDEVAVPVVLIEDLSDKPGPQQEATFTMFVPAAGGATNITLLLENSSVGSIFFIDEITISAASTSILQIQLTATAPVTPAAGGVADKTWNDNTQTPVVSGTMFADLGVFVGPDVWNHRTLSQTPQHIHPKLILRPGQLISVRNTTTNQELRVVINARIVPIAVA